jgi:hypothetical protein
MFPCVLWSFCTFTAVASAESPADRPGDADRYNVVWDSPSKDASDSMPIGNGDIGLNVWVEKGGDLLFYIGKTDSVSENSDLLKLGRIRVHLSPNPFEDAEGFRQELSLRRGEISIDAGQGDKAKHLRVWVDANRPEIHVEAGGPEPFDIQAAGRQGDARAAAGRCGERAGGGRDGRQAGGGHRVGRRGDRRASGNRQARGGASLIRPRYSGRRRMRVPTAEVRQVTLPVLPLRSGPPPALSPVAPATSPSS